ncbi:unnamed protein product [Adineta steineri]|uniref:Protein kinase domain-containing protein n=1 Tax=Adineta steineri TaxID=433720 RepID=A0A815LCX7_9BILA|nr:unnamed protein product [Adineta steineri]CAF1616106.1 unnamed protein product [Adineta steineri]
MESTIKRHAINRIIRFAAKYDLRLTKYVINIVHEAIDAFFDFVLVTNRRSTDEWNKLRDDALQWGENFFEQYRSAIGIIASEANRRLPERFRERRLDIEKKAMDDCETRGIRLDERLDTVCIGHRHGRIPIPLTLNYLLSKNKNDERLQNALDHRKQGIRHYLVDLEATVNKMGDQMKMNMLEWIAQEHNKYKQKVRGYHRVVCRTIQDRQKVFQLARLFVPKFVRIECHLEANLHLAAHHGSRPVVSYDEVLGTRGFFTVHPASWNDEHGLVAKKLREHINDQNFAYLEAHFHRTTRGRQCIYFCLAIPLACIHFLSKNMSSMTADKAIKISCDIASVIAHMHAFDLVHRDIKVENILMDEHENVYLADFGTCQHGAENSTLVGSFPLSPDLTALLQLTGSSSSSDRQYSYEGTAVDVYLLSMLMFVCAPKGVYIPPSNRILEQI